MIISENIKKRYSDLIAVVILVVFVFWFGQEMVWDTKVPFFRDLNTYFYPLRYSLAEALKAGRFPLWDRHTAMGFPLLADFQSGVFYPPHLVFLVLSFFQAIRALFMFHYLVAIIGGYLLCRWWNYPHYHAMIGGLLFTLGGTTVSLTNLLNHFQSAVWLPVSVLLWERFLQRRSWGLFVVLALLLCNQFLAGSPEIYGLTLVLLLLDGIAIHGGKGFAQYIRPLWFLAAANALVLALAAVQLLPTLELFFVSRRQESIPFREAMDWSLDPWSLVNLIFLDKQVDMGMGDGTQLFFGRNIPFFISYYFGAITFFGFCFWLLYESPRQKLVLAGLIGTSLIFAFGTCTPIYPFLYQHISFFRSFRFPEKWFFLTQAFLLFAVLRGLSGFSQADQRRAVKGLATIAALCGIVLMTYLVLRFNPEYLAHFILQHKAMNLPFHFTVGNTASTLVSLERQLALMGGLLLLFFLIKTQYLGQALFNVLLVGIVFVDLNWAHQSFQYLLKPESVVNSPKILHAPESELSRLFYYPHGRNLHPSYFSISRPPSTPFNEVASIVASNLLPNFGILSGFDYMQDINALSKEAYIVFLRFVNRIEPDRQFRLLGNLNVKYVVSFRALQTPGIELVQDFPQYPSWLYRVNRTLPRVYVVGRTKVERDPNSVLEALSSDHWDPSREVMLDEPISLTTTGEFEGQAELVNYGHQHVVIHTFAKSDSILVLADSYYPGWRVYVDGKEEKILRANYFFRAVKLGMGDHRVEFDYDPYSFKIGLIISLTTLLVIIAVSFYLCLRHWKYTG